MKQALRWMIITVVVLLAVIFSPILLFMAAFAGCIVGTVGSICFVMAAVEWAFKDDEMCWTFLEFAWVFPLILAVSGGFLYGFFVLEDLGYFG